MRRDLLELSFHVTATTRCLGKSSMSFCVPYIPRQVAWKGSNGTELGRPRARGLCWPPGAAAPSSPLVFPLKPGPVTVWFPSSRYCSVLCNTRSKHILETSQAVSMGFAQRTFVCKCGPVYESKPSQQKHLTFPGKASAHSATSTAQMTSNKHCVKGKTCGPRRPSGELFEPVSGPLRRSCPPTQGPGTESRVGGRAKIWHESWCRETTNNSLQGCLWGCVC